MESKDYSNYTLQELYDIYRTMDNEKYPEESRLIYNLMVMKEKEEKSLNALASPWERLGASFIDGIIIHIPMFTALLYIGFQKFLSIFIQYGILISFLVVIINQAIYLAINGWLLYSNGQTIGKKNLGIKIVTLKKDIPSLGKSYGLRHFVNGLIGIIPLLGPLYAFIDMLFIFSEEHRCLHDRIAGTLVISG